MNDVIIELCRLDPKFGQTRIWSPKLMRTAHDNLGLVTDWKKIHETSTSFSHGKYQMMDRYFGGDAGTVEAVSSVVSDIKKTQAKIVETDVVPAFVFGKKIAKESKFATVPALDPMYVSFGHYRDVESILKSRKFFPFFITGHSGNGKSSMPLQICAKHKIPLIRINMTKSTDEEKLIGRHTLVDGNVVIEEGPVLIAMRSGIPVMLEEFDAADANSIMCLQGILEGKPYFFALSGEYVNPAPGFTIIATANTKGKGSDDGRYIGTNVLNEAFLERFAATFEQEFPNAATEKRIVMNWMAAKNCVNEEFADELVKWADAIRKTFADGAVGELIATRRLEHIVGSYSIFNNKEKAIEMCTARFDELTSSAFRQLFKQISNPEPVSLDANPDATASYCAART